MLTSPLNVVFLHLRNVIIRFIIYKARELVLVDATARKGRFVEGPDKTDCL